MNIPANKDCCEEAALGLPFYAPCNQPATKVVGWKGRSDTPIRMCVGCTDHNVRNRGGYVVCDYPVKFPSDPDEVVEMCLVSYRGQRLDENYQRACWLTREAIQNAFDLGFKAAGGSIFPLTNGETK